MRCEKDLYMFTSYGRLSGYLTHFSPQKLLALLLLAALVSGCAQLPKEEEAPPPDRATQAAQAMERGDYSRAPAL